MSATNRGLDRVEKDVYPTPPWAVERFLECVCGDACDTDLSHGVRWLEPCAGDGSIIRTVNHYFAEHPDDGDPPPVWHAVELRADQAKRLSMLSGVQKVYAGWDFLKWTPPPGVTYDVVITNPPYSLAQAFVEHARKFAETVVMLLRVNFLGSEERGEWLQKNPVQGLYVLPNRPSFGVNKQGKMGTDATEYAWFVWKRQYYHQRIQVLNTTDSKIRTREWEAAFGPKEAT